MTAPQVVWIESSHLEEPTEDDANSPRQRSGSAKSTRIEMTTDYDTAWQKLRGAPRGLLCWRTADVTCVCCVQSRTVCWCRGDSATVG